MAQQQRSATHPAPVIMVGFIKFIKRIAAFVLAPLVVAFCLQAYFSITGAVAWQDLTWMLVGLVGYFAIYVVINSNNLRFLETLEHELNHAVTSILSFNTVGKFRVSFPKYADPDAYREEQKYSGIVTYVPNGCFFITLSPYFLPLITIPLLVIRPIMPAPLVPVLTILIGSTLGFHYAALIKEFRPFQPDIKEQTLLFSFVIAVLFNVVILVLVISVVVDNIRLTFDYLREALARSFGYYSVIAAWIGELGIPAKLQEIVTLLSA